MVGAFVPGPFPEDYRVIAKIDVDLQRGYRFQQLWPHRFGFRTHPWSLEHLADAMFGLVQPSLSL